MKDIYSPGNRKCCSVHSRFLCSRLELLVGSRSGLRVQQRSSRAADATSSPSVRYAKLTLSMLMVVLAPYMSVALYHSAYALSPSCSPEHDLLMDTEYVDAASKTG